MTHETRFLFTTCQVGFENAVKDELARSWPDLRLAFSRPGFLTFKIPEDRQIGPNVDLAAVFVRSHGLCRGKVQGGDVETLARQAWELYGQRPFHRIHVWPRDIREPGRGGFEPSITPAAIEAYEAIRRHCPDPELLAEDTARAGRPAQFGQTVLDCVLVEAAEWWVGYHQVHAVPGQWPGAITPLRLPPDAVSRAWLKMEEALRWSRLPIRPGAQVVEIGSAPGGASQAMLARGFIVTGIDPAEMDPAVLENPNFTHIRRRASAVRRREFRKTRWLTADMNVAPDCTLDAVEETVMHPTANIRGLLLTLKLPQRDLAQQVPDYLRRVESWGFNKVAARQLVQNRQEICVAGLQKPFRRKSLFKR